MIVQGGLAELPELIDHSDAMIRAAFAPHEPLRAHAALDPAEYAIICESLIAAFQRDGAARALFRALLDGAGGAEELFTQIDWFRGAFAIAG